MNNQTKSFLQNLKEGIEKGDSPEERFCKTKAEMSAWYETLKDIANSLTSHELYLIWYLRSAGSGETFNFMIAAKKASEVRSAFLKLGE